MGGSATVLPLWVCHCGALVSISVPPSQSYITSSPSTSVAWGLWVQLGEGLGDGQEVGKGVCEPSPPEEGARPPYVLARWTTGSARDTGT